MLSLVQILFPFVSNSLSPTYITWKEQLLIITKDLIELCEVFIPGGLA